MVDKMLKYWKIAAVIFAAGIWWASIANALKDHTDETKIVTKEVVKSNKILSDIRMELRTLRCERRTFQKDRIECLEEQLTSRKESSRDKAYTLNAP